MALEKLKDDQFADTLSKQCLAYFMSFHSKGDLTWCKMDYVQQLTNVGAMLDAGTGVLALQRLKSTEVMYSLGRIAAVDLFLGNQDRFKYPFTDPNANDPSHQRHSVAEPSLDNIFLRPDALKKGGYTAIGLDFYLPVGSHSNLCAEPAGNWEYHHLASDSALYAYCVDNINRLNNALEKLLQKSGTTYSKSDLPSPYDFYYGACEGAKILKAFLQNNDELKKQPGIAKRMEKLGW
jgi:hypothetical protein